MRIYRRLSEARRVGPRSQRPIDRTLLWQVATRITHWAAISYLAEPVLGPRVQHTREKGKCRFLLGRQQLTQNRTIHSINGKIVSGFDDKKNPLMKNLSTEAAANWASTGLAKKKLSTRSIRRGVAGLARQCASITILIRPLFPCKFYLPTWKTSLCDRNKTFVRSS